MRQSGFTLIEVVITLAITGLLMALLIPAVLSARSAARRTQCISNLKQLGIAMHAFHDQHQMFPPGSIKGKSLHIAILPFIDQTALSASLPDSPSAKELQQLTTTSLPLFLCPEDAARHFVPATAGPGYPARTNYKGNFGTGVQSQGYNGMFRNIARGPIRAADVTDGLAQTAAISEALLYDGSQNLRRVSFSTPFPLIKPDELEQFAALCRATATNPASARYSKAGFWYEGSPPYTLYNHVLYPNDATCHNSTKIQEGAYSASSEHPKGVNVLYGDGHVGFVQTDIDQKIWRAIGTRAGGEFLTN